MVAPMVTTCHARLTTTKPNIDGEQLVRMARGEMVIAQAESMTSHDAGEVDSVSFHAPIVARGG